MALSRVKVWSAGEILTASDLNTEFNNYITNVASLVTPVTFNLTFTDATYDIGASGATRPRDMYLSRDITLGRNLITAASANICEGRITLTTALPVTTADVTAATTVYFTPCAGNRIALYDGASNWTTLTFSELSLAVPATTSTMYDLWAYNNSGTAALEALAWTNDTTRATALTLQNGVLVKTGATTRRYLGSFRTTTASGQTEDSAAKRYVWNYYNRKVRLMNNAIETTDSWTYTTATYRQANANTANQLDMVIGYAEDPVRAVVHSVASSSAAAGNVAMVPGIGVDSTTVNSCQLIPVSGNLVTGLQQSNTGFYIGYPGVGRHTLVWIEYSLASGTTTWYGDGGAAPRLQSGISGELLG